MTKMVATTGAIRHAKLQSNHHHQQTDTQFFTGQMPFLSSNQQHQRTERKCHETLHDVKMHTTVEQAMLTTNATGKQNLLINHLTFLHVEPLVSQVHHIPACGATRVSGTSHSCMRSHQCLRYITFLHEEPLESQEIGRASCRERV